MSDIHQRVSRRAHRCQALCCVLLVSRALCPTSVRGFSHAVPLTRAGCGPLSSVGVVTPSDGHTAAGGGLQAKRARRRPPSAPLSITFSTSIVGTLVQ